MALRNWVLATVALVLFLGQAPARADDILTYTMTGTAVGQFGSNDCPSWLVASGCTASFAFSGKYSLDLQSLQVVGPWSFSYLSNWDGEGQDWVIGEGMGNPGCANQRQPPGANCELGFVEIQPSYIYFSQPNSLWPIGSVIGWIALDATQGRLLSRGTFSPFVWTAPRLDGPAFYTSTVSPEPASWLTLASGLLLALFFADYRRMGVRKSSVTQSSPSGAR